MVALAARFMSDHYGTPVKLIALLLGMAINFVSTQGACQDGIEVTGRQVLCLGVALLGLRITFDQVSALGWQPVLVVVGAVAFTISMDLLTGGAVGICGCVCRIGPVSGHASTPP